jgi:hypothetical protein
MIKSLNFITFYLNSASRSLSIIKSGNTDRYAPSLKFDLNCEASDRYAPSLKFDLNCEASDRFAPILK